MRKLIYLATAVLMILALTSCSVLGMSGGNTPASADKAKNSSATVLTYKDASATSVNVAGEFNGWSTTDDPMTKKGDTWQIELNLEPGKYMYKFVVNGSEWKADPENPDVADDGFGGQNSVLTAGGSAKKSADKDAAKKGVKFTWKPDDDAEHDVYLAGDFNNWSTTADKMEKNGDVYETALELSAGKYGYKFIADGNWITDENASETIDDGYGGQNSIITVGEGTKSVKIEKPAPADESYKGEFPVTFTYKPLTGGKKNVFLAGDFNNWSPTATPMNEKDGNYDITLKLKMGKYGYKFVVDGNWVTDENAEEFVGDGYGGQNSIVFAGDMKEINALRKVTFKYDPGKPVTDVYLAGSMNDWNQKRDMMTDADGDGVYEVTKLLKGAEYTYKFVVNGSEWVTDPNAVSFVDDGFGGQNSVIVVDDRYPAVTMEKGDGEFLQYGLPFGQSIETINPLNPGLIELKTRVHNNDVEHVSVWIDDLVLEMKLVAVDNSFSYFQYMYELSKAQGEFDYTFMIEDGGKIWYMTNSGYSTGASDRFHYSPETVEAFYTPDWVKDGIVYQIFPERFANGDKANDPDFKEWYYEGVNIPPKPEELLPKYRPYYHLIKDWYDISGLTKSPYHAPNQDGYQPEYNSYYGGDIAGIQQNLDYLSDLGITIIYFNPLFQAKSNHKYDAADYMKLDPHFGTNEEFRAFVADCHARGIKIIIDCAFNHTGETFWAFQDGVKKGKESEYWDWYEWKKWPLPDTNSPGYKPSDYYECWWGFGEMPNLNYDLTLSNPEENSLKNMADADPNMPVVNHVLDVVDFWIGDMDLDGFRLDVPNEVPFWFWKLFRERVKANKEDAWLCGEIWSNAVDWVNNDVFDSVMNYAYFKDPVQRFFNMRQCSAATFDRDLKPGLLTYPTQSAQTMMNLIDSHDTFRYLETAKGDVSTLKLAAFFEMTYVGAPHIWYGDEIAMMGKHDPDCRRPFNWKYKDNPKAVDLLDYYKKIIAIRKENDALRRGSFKTLLTDGMVYAYQREFKNDKIVMLINNEASEKMIELPLDTGMRSVNDLITGEQYQVNNGKITVKAAPYTGYIFK
ncbi:MAG: alpha-glucosidase C-terminal domain-containing protein [Candidatus Cloacimonetes bacterium]|nr:alpha-glucosidase C-terminal domain-containing protein [Candidatus Cloacimonadota bacterium]